MVKRRWVLVNKTDGILATPTYFDTEVAAQRAADEFRLRFCLIGYYHTARGEKIAPDKIELEVHPDGGA